VTGLHRSYIGLGSNAGDPIANVERAIEELATIGTVERTSSLYQTKPWGNTDQPDFINAVVLLQTPFPPQELLANLKSIERKLGRVATQRWGPREIDLDILTYDDILLDEPNLQIPHPFLAQRGFVLIPLAELDAAYAAARDGLPNAERSSVTSLSRVRPKGS
jgi:2-amino-4-hydroxy-6-hydroxymethyldihydropteridine diphosphokinase